MKTVMNAKRDGVSSGVIVSAVAFTVSTVMILLGMRLTEGHWIYTLDDAYIHLAVAKNLALYGMWGVSPETFTSCSSSPLWTLILAALFKVSGVREWLPGAINIGCVLLSLLAIDRTLTEYGVTRRMRSVAGLAIFLLAPLVVIASTGMEHCLHVFLTVVFLRAVLAELKASGSEGWARTSALCGWALLMTAARFESLFVAVPVAFVLILKGQRRAGVLIVLSALMPVLAHGAYSLAHGGFFLPNSLVLKGRIPGGGLGDLMSQLFSVYVRVSLENVHVHILCLALLATACCRRIPEEIRLMALAVTGACICHVTFSECGRFYRYEAYLMTSGFLLLASAWLPDIQRLRNVLSRQRLCGSEGWILLPRLGLVLFLAVPLCLRGLWATSRVIPASANIYQQQWQSARIFETMDLQGMRVAVNDLGVMAYRSGAQLVDLWGLGSTEVARLKLANQYDRQAVADLLRRQRVGYIMVFDQWFARGRELPDDLILVARLRIVKRAVSLQDTVMLYATGRAEAEKLREHLSHLPFALPQGAVLEMAP